MLKVGVIAASGYLADDVEAQEQYLRSFPEFVPLLDIKASWRGLRQQLKATLRELFLLERDPGFDVEAAHTMGELQRRCEQVSAMLPGNKPWYQH